MRNSPAEFVFHLQPTKPIVIAPDRCERVWFGCSRASGERSRHLIALVVVAAVGLMTACDTDKTGSPNGAGSDRARVDRDIVTVRPIVRESAAPCAAPAGAAELVLPDPANPDNCLSLGPAGVDASDVADAHLETTGLTATEVAVSLKLTERGERAFMQLATAHLHERLAIVVRGKVVAAPTVQEPSTTVMLVTGLTSSEATDLVRALGGDTTPPTTSPRQAELDRATKLCDEYGKQTGQTSSGGGPMTAGEITTIMRRLTGSTAPPWDSLPVDHFVARCSYVPPTSGMPPTTVCPNGDREVLTRPTQKLVDEEGRVTDDPAVAAVPFTPCRFSGDKPSG